MPSSSAIFTNFIAGRLSETGTTALLPDYRNHLAVEVEKEAKNDSEQNYTVSTQKRTLLFGAPPVNERAQVKMVTDSRPSVEKLVMGPTRAVGKPDQPLSLTVQKYQAVSALQATLSTPVKSAPEQMKDFRAQFKIQRPVIEQDRDSWAMKFAKGVATVLSLGVAWLCGIWNVKGQEAANGPANHFGQAIAAHWDLPGGLITEDSPPDHPVQFLVIPYRGLVGGCFDSG